MKKLSYDEFKDALVEEVRKAFPEEEVSVNTIPSVNRQKESLILKRGTVSPSLDMIGLYEDYLDELDFDEVSEHVIGLFNIPAPEFDIQELFSWEHVKGHIQPMVINLEKNRKFLAESGLVYRSRLDLAIIYYVNVTNFPGQNGVLKITEQLMKNWGVTESDLYEQAKENGEYFREQLFDCLTIISNRRNYAGAAAMFFSDEVKKMAEEVENDLYILPSSLHEILIKEREDCAGETELLRMLVDSVNNDSDVMKQEDILSDTVYIYKRETGEVEIAA